MVKVVVRALLVALAKFRGCQLDPIVVGSIGRSGSTMLWVKISEARVQKLLPSFLRSALVVRICAACIRKGVWSKGDLGSVCSIMVCKTHLLLDENDIPRSWLLVYIAASPSSVLNSLILLDGEDKTFLTRHLRNFDLEMYIEPNDWSWFVQFIRVALFDYKKSLLSIDCLVLDLEFLWKEREVLDQFLKLTVDLPEFRKRRSRSFDCASIVPDILSLDKEYERAFRVDFK